MIWMFSKSKIFEFFICSVRDCRRKQLRNICNFYIFSLLKQIFKIIKILNLMNLSRVSNPSKPVDLNLETLNTISHEINHI